MLPKDASKLEELLVQSETLPWREKSLKGISEKMLWRDDKTVASIALIKFAEGAGIPQPHFHASNQFMFCLRGRYEYTSTGVTLTAGSFYCNPKGNVHGPAIAHEETVVIEIYDGPHYPEKPSWYSDEQDARKRLAASPCPLARTPALPTSVHRTMTQVRLTNWRLGALLRLRPAAV